MPLFEDNKFKKKNFSISAKTIEEILNRLKDNYNFNSFLCLGFENMSAKIESSFEIEDVTNEINNMFRLGNKYDFESQKNILTLGIRSSRFAKIIFWEAAHILAKDGIIIDIDYIDNIKPTLLSEKDFLEREYYNGSILLEKYFIIEAYSVKIYKKIEKSMIADDVKTGGWTFGILNTPDLKQTNKMVKNILKYAPEKFEIIICGVIPENLTKDERISSIDFYDKRGWISKKKNLIAQKAKYGNLCIMHDRYEISEDFLKSLKNYGKVLSMLTVPQFYFYDLEKKYIHKYPDYHLVMDDPIFKKWDYDKAAYKFEFTRLVNLFYDDFYETASCCGGIYITHKSIWNFIKKHEALLHCELEDVMFGLEVQRVGVPNRVNNLNYLESTKPYLSSIPYTSVYCPGGEIKGQNNFFPNVDPFFVKADFKPVFESKKQDYYDKIVKDFNLISILSDKHKIKENEYTHFIGLFDFWNFISKKLSVLKPETRDQVREIVNFCQRNTFAPRKKFLSQYHIRKYEIGFINDLSGYKKVIGWGTGAYFQECKNKVNIKLDYLVDNNPNVQNTVFSGLNVYPSSKLLEENPDSTAIVVFSRFYYEIQKQIRAIGNFKIGYPSFPFNNNVYDILHIFISFAKNLESSYPMIFIDSVNDAALNMGLKNKGIK
ncbi:MAG: hypothetical protein PHC34_12580 [Candidatus Gastranaerophilales bacterium]|nr:hypothetical protein [Candidatus Gastranaerophilales bacterium]